jgi:hypothetical protein
MKGNASMPKPRAYMAQIFPDVLFQVIGSELGSA